ncbi:unknown [Brachyspira sp. CAG:484]|nr:unknown [Brachyspira sp. CAG:484]
MDIAYGTKIINRKTNEIGLLIKTWLNDYADGGVWFATCVDKNGKRYHIELDEITPIEENEHIV